MKKKERTRRKKREDKKKRERGGQTTTTLPGGDSYYCIFYSTVLVLTACPRGRETDRQKRQREKRGSILSCLACLLLVCCLFVLARTDHVEGKGQGTGVEQVIRLIDSWAKMLGGRVGVLQGWPCCLGLHTLVCTLLVQAIDRGKN